jgi:hypothetical protein
MQSFARNGFGLVFEEIFGAVVEQFFNFRIHNFCKIQACGAASQDF